MLRVFNKFPKGYHFKNYLGYHFNYGHSFSDDAITNEKKRTSKVSVTANEKQKKNKNSRENFKKENLFEDLNTKLYNLYFFEAIGLGTAIMVHFHADSTRYQMKPWCPVGSLKSNPGSFADCAFKALHPTFLGRNFCPHSFFNSSSSVDYQSDQITQQVSKSSSNLAHLDYGSSSANDEIAFFIPSSKFTRTYELEGFEDFVLIKNSFSTLEKYPPLLGEEKFEEIEWELVKNSNELSSEYYPLHNVSSKPDASYLKTSFDDSSDQPKQHMKLTKTPKSHKKKSQKPSTEQENLAKELFQIMQGVYNENLLCLAKKQASEGNHAQAVKVWKKILAKDDKHQKALYNLALCYEKGLGLEKNEKKALSLYSRSAKEGNEQALKKLDFLKSKNTIFPAQEMLPTSLYPPQTARQKSEESR